MSDRIRSDWWNHKNVQMFYDSYMIRKLFRQMIRKMYIELSDKERTKYRKLTGYKDLKDNLKTLEKMKKYKNDRSKTSRSPSA